MKQYTYSVTITHYNAPVLLSRMLKSIPERDDIQVIVVDDCSKAENKEELQKLSHKNLELVICEENQGAGHARNVGLMYARGKWLIGVDCDDVFDADAWSEFDKYKDRDDELDFVSYFVSVLDPKTGEKLQKLSDKKLANVSVLKYYNNPSLENLMLFKYCNTDTWNKMVSMRFIKEHNIKWEDCRVNVDVYYSFQIGAYGRSFEIIPKELYHAYYDDTESITRKHRTIEREFQFYLAAQKRNGFYERIGLKRYPFYRTDLMYLIHFLKKIKLKGTIEFFKYRRAHISDVNFAKQCYRDLHPVLSL